MRTIPAWRSGLPWTLGHLFPDDMDTALSPGLRAARAIAAQFRERLPAIPDASLYAGKSDRTLATLRAALARMSTRRPPSSPPPANCSTCWMCT